MKRNKRENEIVNPRMKIGIAHKQSDRPMIKRNGKKEKYIREKIGREKAIGISKTATQRQLKIYVKERIMVGRGYRG